MSDYLLNGEVRTIKAHRPPTPIGQVLGVGNLEVVRDFGHKVIVRVGAELTFRNTNIIAFDENDVWVDGWWLEC